jgi:type I restriction enzyme S subunit
MGKIGILKKFSEIGATPYFLYNYQFFDLKEKIDSKIEFKQVRLSDYFDIISGFAFSSKDYTTEGVKVCRISDIKKTGRISLEKMRTLPEEYIEKYSNYKILENDILIGMTGDGVYFKTGIFNHSNTDVLLNQRVGILRLKEGIKDCSPKFISLLFNLKEVQNQIKIVAMGKTQKNVSPFDILNVSIPKLSFEKQLEIVELIKPIELEIKTLEDNSLDTFEIFNIVFAEELGFNLEQFKKLKAENKFSSNLKEFSNNIDCRFSFKFHNKAGQYVWDFLCSKTNKRIKDFISEPIVLGKSVSPKDYDDDGDYFYIAMSSIKTWAFDPESCKTVSNAYSEANKNKSVQKDDIILARSGEGTIGKVALIEDEEIDAIHADFTQRIRLTNYNARLAYYYMRSDLFQYLVYTHKKGLGNNTNIFPSQVQEFPIPDWEETKQTELVDKIKTQIDEQKEIDKQIAEKQAEISAIIKKAIQTE